MTTTQSTARRSVYTLAVILVGLASLTLHIFIGSQITLRATDVTPAIPVGITASASVETTPAAEPPACEYEDASDLADGASCRWDAGASGNGIGESFTATRYGTIVVYAYDNGHSEWIDRASDDPEPLEVGDGWAPPTDGVDDFDWTADTDSDRI